MFCMKDYTGQKFNMLTAFDSLAKIKTSIFGFPMRLRKRKRSISTMSIEKLSRSSRADALPIENIQESEAIQYSCYAESYSDGDLTFEEFVKISQKPCLYCGKLAKDSNCRKTRVKPKVKKILKSKNLDTMDWIELITQKPHMKDNVVPCCFRCNSWKQNLTFKEFKTIIGRIHLRLEIYTFKENW